MRYLIILILLSSCVSAGVATDYQVGRSFKYEEQTNDIFYQ